MSQPNTIHNKWEELLQEIRDALDAFEAEEIYGSDAEILFHELLEDVMGAAAIYGRP